MDRIGPEHSGAIEKPTARIMCRDIERALWRGTWRGDEIVHRKNHIAAMPYLEASNGDNEGAITAVPLRFSCHNARADERDPRCR
jgi:hypothetical protein